MDISELLEKSRGNLNVFDAFAKANDVINNPKYKHIMCSISGGSDSDIMLDLLYRVDVDKKIQFVWFDTGLEYKATKEQLVFLENKYGITIYREKALQPIPITTRKVGQPFLSKQVSEMMGRAQKHGFKWEDKSFEELMEEYPNCKTVIMWWCNKWNEGKEMVSRYSISQNKWLKEFIIANPPTFNIANKCCTYAKKNVAKQYIKENDIDLNVIGVRKAEGGTRSGAYKSCYSTEKNKFGADQYRPLFWFKDEDKRYYEEVFGVTHSDCYVKYGMTRTGCAGCPFNRKFEDERSTIETYEPKLYKGINKIFADSYEYTRKYRAFCEEMNAKQKEKGYIQMKLDL